MKKIIPLIIAFFLFTSFSPAFAETKTFIKEYTYQASEADSKISSRVIALEQVKRLLLEELGTYLESHTEIVNFQLKKDQITALTAGIVQTQILKEKWDGERYWIQAKIDADPAKVAEDIDALRKDREKSKELENVRKKADDLSKEVERLRKELELSKKDQTKIARYDEAVKELSATDFVQKGYSFQAAEKYEEAIDAFTKAIQLNPKYAEAFAIRGFNYAELGNYEQALEDLNKAIELAPKNAEVYYARAAVYLKSGNYKRSIEDFDKAIEVNPKLAVLGYGFRGLVYNQLGNYNQAIEDYNKAIELNPKDAGIYNGRGTVYVNLGNYKQAIEDYNRAVDLNPKLAVVYYNRGIAYAMLGNYHQAIEDYNKAIELNQKYAAAYNYRGAAYDKLGNYKKAMKDYNRAIELDPKYAAAYYLRANSYFRHGNEERAIQDFKVAASLGDQEAQDFLNNEGVDWTLEGVSSATSSDKPPQKPVKNVELSTDVEQRYRGIKGIVLKNGNVIEGQILSWNSDIVKIRTKDGKILSYDFRKDIQTFITK